MKNVLLPWDLEGVYSVSEWLRSIVRIFFHPNDIHLYGCSVLIKKFTLAVKTDNF